MRTRNRKSLSFVFTAAVIGGLGCVAVSPSAVAVPGTGATSMADVVVFEDYECKDYPYSFSFELPAGVDSWNLQSDLIDQTGLSYTGDYQYSLDSAPAVVSGTGEFQVCSGTYGTFQLTAVVEYTDYEGSADGSFSLPVSSVSIRPAATRTRLKAVKVAPSSAAKSRITAKIHTRVERPLGYFAAAGYDVCLQTRVAGSWARLRGSCETTNSAGIARVDAKIVVKRALKVRAITKADEANGASTSRPVTLRP
jgi:hypothetical protein